MRKLTLEAMGQAVQEVKMSRLTLLQPYKMGSLDPAWVTESLEGLPLAGLRDRGNLSSMKIRI